MKSTDFDDAAKIDKLLAIKAEAETFGKTTSLTETYADANADEAMRAATDVVEFVSEDQVDWNFDADMDMDDYMANIGWDGEDELVLAP
eukprot:g14332.t1